MSKLRLSNVAASSKVVGSTRAHSAPDVATDARASLIGDGFTKDGQSEATRSATKSSPQVNGPGLVGVGGVSVVALQASTKLRAAKVRPFALMAEEARKRGLEVYVLGGGATSFGAQVKAGLLFEGGDPRFRGDWVTSNEASAFLNLATQDLDVVIARSDGKPESLDDISSFQAFVDGQLSGIEVDVRGLRTAKDNIHFPLTKGSPFFDEHHNNMDLLGLHLTAGADQPSLVDVAALQGAGKSSAVDDLAASTVRLMLSDLHDKTPTGKTGNSPPVKHALRALIKAVRHELTPDPTSKVAMRKLFAEWGGHVDPNTVVGRWMFKNLGKLVTDAMDLKTAFKLLDDVGALASLRASDDPGLAKLFRRQPFIEEKADGPPTGETAKSLGIDKLWHLTDDYEAFLAMSRTPLWRPNFLASTGDDGTVARYGAGVYFTQAGEAWGEASGKQSRGYLVELKLDPAAKEGPDFKRVVSDSGQTFIVVKKRNVLTLDQQPLHNLKLDSVFTMLFASETAARLHVLEQLQERLLVLAADPAERQLIAQRLLKEAKTRDPERICDLVPILSNEGLRAIAPGVVSVLIDRLLAKADVVTMLELLDAPTDDKTLRDFAKNVMPLVNDHAGIFIHTFGARLFTIFNTCPDALAPILKACGDERTMLVHGLESGQAKAVPLLVELAKELDASDRRYIRSWHAEQLEKPGFEPVARALS